METSNKTVITIECIVNAAKEKVWVMWTAQEHIIKWNNASEDWHTTQAENDLQVGGKFQSRIEAKDESFGFDFWGIFDEIRIHDFIAYTLGDGRKVSITFIEEGTSTKVIEAFEAETQNSIELQRGGWQNILDNFKKHVESN